MDRLDIASYIATATLCAWAWGIGGRMALEYYFYHRTVYTFNAFDAWFDWTMLFVWAWVVIIINDVRLYRQSKAESALRNDTAANRPDRVTP